MLEGDRETGRFRSFAGGEGESESELEEDCTFCCLALTGDLD